MAGSCAYVCSKVYPHCAYVLTAGLDATNLPLILTHIAQEHGHQRPVVSGATIMDGFTLS
jgi:hypothetical protein